MKTDEYFVVTDGNLYSAYEKPKYELEIVAPRLLVFQSATQPNFVRRFFLWLLLGWKWRKL